MDYVFSSQEISELSKALLAVQRCLQPAVKDAVNPFIKNRYATLNSIMDSCRMALLNNGILLTQYPVPVDGENLGLVTKLVHAESGQYQAGLAVIPLAKADPQAMGSAFTYGRRYALSAMLGIVTEEDDDGNAASSYSRQNGGQKTVKPVSQQQQQTYPKKMATRVSRLTNYLQNWICLTCCHAIWNTCKMNTGALPTNCRTPNIKSRSPCWKNAKPSL